MFFNSIRIKILFLGLVFLVLIGISFLIYSVLTTEHLKLLRLEGIEKTVSYETEKVNKLITEIEHGAVFYSISAMVCFKAQSEKLGGELVIENIKVFPALTAGGFWFEPYAFKKDWLRAGFYSFRDRGSGVVLNDNTFYLDDYDYHHTEWYREIIENITKPYQVVWKKPYLDDSGIYGLMTTAGSGVFDEEGRLIAITTADWEIEEVIRELTAIKPTANSFVILCVPEKDYIISSTRTSETIGLSMSHNIPWDITADAFNFNGIDYLRFGKYMDNGWLLSIQIPEREIFAEVEKRNERFSILFIIVFILMLLLGWFLISMLVNVPLIKLTNDVRRIAHGDLDLKIKINSKDEMGLLADVFNKMTDDLKQYIKEKTEERLEKERITAELNVAAAIQSSMLPHVCPPFSDRNDFDLHASMIPAKEVCGDFYDFFFIDKDNLVVLIADVSGKGVPAALFMVIAKTLIKNCSSCRTPKTVFDSVNKKLCESNETGMFVTAFIGFYNLPTGKFTYVNAGHNPPLFKKKNGSFAYLNTKPCIILGFINDAKYFEDELTLEGGDTLFLYTDGVTEAMNKTQELFGEQRLLEAADKNADVSVKKMLVNIKNEVNAFSKGSQQADDITMLVLHIKDQESETKNEEFSELNELKVSAHAENLEKVISYINSKLETCDYSADKKNEICIAVEEIFVNIASYAYDNEKGDVTISVSVTDSKKVFKTLAKSNTVIPSEITVKFEDTGRPYNPLKQPEPDFSPDLKDRPIGGLGVYMVKNLMDTVEYTRAEEKNMLVISKILTPET